MFRKSTNNLINSIICVGGSHTSGAKCVNDYLRADDDPMQLALRDEPHPDNKANAFWAGISPVMQIGTFLISKPEWDNQTIMFHALDYLIRKPRPEDTVAIIGFEKWNTGTHRDVIDLHEKLTNMKVIHIMFNTQEHLNITPQDQYDFGDSFIDPYNPNGTMVSQLKAQNIDFNPGTEYFGVNGHKRWARILLNRLTQIV